MRDLEYTFSFQPLGHQLVRQLDPGRQGHTSPSVRRSRLPFSHPSALSAFATSIADDDQPTVLLGELEPVLRDLLPPGHCFHGRVRASAPRSSSYTLRCRRSSRASCAASSPALDSFHQLSRWGPVVRTGPRQRAAIADRLEAFELDIFAQRWAGIACCRSVRANTYYRSLGVDCTDKDCAPLVHHLEVTKFWDVGVLMEREKTFSAGPPPCAPWMPSSASSATQARLMRIWASLPSRLWETSRYQFGCGQGTHEPRFSRYSQGLRGSPHNGD